MALNQEIYGDLDGEMMRTTILSVDDIRQIVQHVGLDALMDQLIGQLEEALREYDEQTDIIPSRDGFQYERPGAGLLEWMPAMRVGQRATIKVVGYHPSNPKRRDLPTILSTVGVYDVTNGHLLALADATFLTALRTGAVSAVASRLMARADSAVVGLIGCGAQAVTQLHALSRIFPIEKVLLFDTDPAACDSFGQRICFMDRSGIQLQACSVQQLVGEADIVCTATSVGVGSGPVFQDAACKPWLHVNAVGSDLAGKTELPLSLLERSFVCPDCRDQAEREGECQQLQASQIGPDLVQVIKNKQQFAVTQLNSSVFDSTGWALEDQVAMRMLMDYARQLGLGMPIQIESVSTDPKNPYAFTGAGGDRTYTGRLVAVADQ